MFQNLECIFRRNKSERSRTQYDEILQTLLMEGYEAKQEAFEKILPPKGIGRWIT